MSSILKLWREHSGSQAGTLAEAATCSAETPDAIRAVLRRAVGTNANSAWLLNRFEQFWRESEEIIPGASDALSRHNLKSFGEFVNESQLAAESLLGNQVPETSWLAREALSLGAIAASAFGAGFGGSVWALVPAAEANEFAENWREAYQNNSFQPTIKSEFFVTGAGPSLTRL